MNLIFFMIGNVRKILPNNKQKFIFYLLSATNAIELRMLKIRQSKLVRLNCNVRQFDPFSFFRIISLTLYLMATRLCVVRK